MKGRYQRVERCRVSGSRNLIPVLHLGEQELTGVFPRPGEEVTKGPLDYDRGHAELISRAARLAYPIRDGVPIMLPEEARELGEGE